MSYGVPESTLRKLASGAQRSERAIVVGNRDGFIEWANDAWTRVTGYALDESVSKPVHGFLEGVDIDPSAVDFVARCFREGRVCELELAVTPPNRGELWIQLRVEPLVDASGQVSDFIAMATDVTDRKRSASAGEIAEVDLSELAARVAMGERSLLGDRADFDFDLDRALPLVLADPRKIEALVARRIAHGIESLGDAWGTLTLWTGILGSNPGPLCRANLWNSLPAGQWVFLEIHDSGGHPDGIHYTAVTEPFLSTVYAGGAAGGASGGASGGAAGDSGGYPVRYAEAEAWLRELGGELRMESSPIEGTSVVMLFPYACEDSGWYERS